jgi:hypothetical protein
MSNPVGVPAPPRIPSTQVWRRPLKNLGYAEGLRGRGGTVCPLIAGFALAAIAQLVTAEDAPPLADWAILAFACSVALLVHSMQLAFFALSADPSPATYLAWHPEALVDEDALKVVRKKQINKYQEMVGYWLRSNIAYDLGLVAFLGAILLLLIPDDWSGPRIVAIVVIALAFALEAWWALANRVSAVPHPVVRPGGPPTEIDAPSRAALASVMDPGRVDLARTARASDGQPASTARPRPGRGSA